MGVDLYNILRSIKVEKTEKPYGAKAEVERLIRPQAGQQLNGFDTPGARPI